MDDIIELSFVHKIPSARELKSKTYCKWHNLCSHSTTNCVVFQNAIQDGLTKGHLIFRDKGKIGVDKDLFQKIATINMVEVGQSKTP